MTTVPDGTGTSSPLDLGTRVVFVLVYNAAWYGYLLWSRRVRVTYGLDSPSLGPRRPDAV